MTNTENYEAGTDVTVYEAVTPSRIVGGIPHLNDYMMLAKQISNTAMVPNNLRNRPAEVLAVIMFGAELGIGPMQALQKIDFIEGKPALAAELMRALIRQAGHKLDISVASDGCTIKAERADTGEIGEASFTVQDAVDAGLCVIDNGKVKSRSGTGRKLPWELYTKDLLLARATSRIGRMMFSDVLAGMTYTPEELQPNVEPSEIEDKPAKKATRTVVRSAPPTTKTLATEDQLTRVRAGLAMFGDDDKRELDSRWREAGLGSVASLTSDGADVALDLIDELLTALAPGDGEIVEAEIVTEEPALAPDSPVETTEPEVGTSDGGKSPETELESVETKPKSQAQKLRDAITEPAKAKG